MRAVITITFTILAAATAAAHADENRPAAEWLRIGLEHYERGELAAAIDAFQRGNAREPKPVFLFALGQAYRRQGDCSRARASFDAFLATSPPEAQAVAARDQRERCEPAAAEPDRPPEPARPASPPTPAPAVTDPPPSPPATGEHHWYDDRIAVGAGAATAVLLAGSGALWLSASGAADDAAVTDSYDRHRLLRERAESRELLAGIGLGVGIAAAGVTIWRVTRGRGPRAETPRAAVRPLGSPHAVGLAIGGRF